MPTVSEDARASIEEPGWVRLNVGGQDFHTTSGTLCSRSTYFRSLFEGDFIERGKASLAVDRDPSLFKHVLRFLRSGIVDSEGLSRFERQQLAVEADFFGIEGMREACGGAPIESEAEMMARLQNEEMAAVRLRGDGVYQNSALKQAFCFQPDGKLLFCEGALPGNNLAAAALACRQGSDVSDPWKASQEIRNTVALFWANFIRRGQYQVSGATLSGMVNQPSTRGNTAFIATILSRDQIQVSMQGSHFNRFELMFLPGAASLRDSIPSQWPPRQTATVTQFPSDQPSDHSIPPPPASQGMRGSDEESEESYV